MKYSGVLIIVLIVGMSIFSYGEGMYKNEIVEEKVYKEIYETVTEGVYKKTDKTLKELLCEETDKIVTEEVYEEVYVDDKSGKNHFSNLNDAVKYVKDRGGIYLGKNISFAQTVEISKSISIKSFPKEGKNISIKNKRDLLFKLDDVDYFKMEGVNILGTKYSSAIRGRAGEIYIKNSEFSACYPIIITRGKDCDIYMEGNTIIDGKIEIKPSFGNNKIDLINNTFKKETFKKETNAITFKNINVYGQNNTLDCTSFVIEKGKEIEVYMKNNIFSGTRGTIFIKTDGANIHFNKNKIFKDFKDAVHYIGLEKVDFTNNWWGSKNGSRENIYKENVDVRDWALFENFKRFKGDPYTLEDLRQACEETGNVIDDNNWIYNVKKDDRINILDVVGITRKIE